MRSLFLKLTEYLPSTLDIRYSIFIIRFFHDFYFDLLAALLQTVGLTSETCLPSEACEVQ